MHNDSRAIESSLVRYVIAGALPFFIPERKIKVFSFPGKKQNTFFRSQAEAPLFKSHTQPATQHQKPMAFSLKDGSGSDDPDVYDSSGSYDPNGTVALSFLSHVW
jgi:hypothetical protein